MDEPLGALDRQLREHLQVEIKRIQRALGLTIVYVTHDQDEALTMSDRIAVFAGGRIQQIGRPDTIYETPANARSEEHTSELQSLMRNSSAVFCLHKKNTEDDGGCLESIFPEPAPDHKHLTILRSDPTILNEDHQRNNHT